MIRDLVDRLRDRLPANRRLLAETAIRSLAVSAINGERDELPSGVRKASMHLASELAQFTQVYSLDEAATRFVDALADDLFMADFEVSELAPPDRDIFLEYPYRTVLRARARHTAITMDELNQAPERIGVLLQVRDGEWRAGIIVERKDGIIPPPAMADITRLSCPRMAPYWKAGYVAELLVTDMGREDVEILGKEALDAFAQPIFEELPMLLAFLVLLRGEPPLVIRSSSSNPLAPKHVRLAASAPPPFYSGFRHENGTGDLEWQAQPEPWAAFLPRPGRHIMKVSDYVNAAR
jgi:hypothetical protein